MWLLDVSENQTSSQKREDLSSLRISKKFFFWFKMLRPFQKSHSRNVWNNVSIITVRACTQGDSFKWSFFALSLKASFPLLTASVAQQTPTLRGCITWGQAGRKQQRCWEFSLSSPFRSWKLGRGRGTPQGAGQECFLYLALTHQGRHILFAWTSSRAALSTQKCFWADKSNLLVPLQATGLDGKWRGVQRGWNALANSAPLLLLSIQWTCDEKEWFWGLATSEVFWVRLNFEDEAR